MAVVRPSSGPIRFGTFEVDPNAGELRKRGVRVKLQEQPLQILQVLLERPGEMVTRQELRRYGRDSALHRNAATAWIPLHRAIEWNPS